MQMPAFTLIYRSRIEATTPHRQYHQFHMQIFALKFSTDANDLCDTRAIGSRNLRTINVAVWPNNKNDEKSIG